MRGRRAQVVGVPMPNAPTIVQPTADMLQVDEYYAIRRDRDNENVDFAIRPRRFGCRITKFA